MQNFWYTVIFFTVLYVVFRASEKWIIPRFSSPEKTIESREFALQIQIQDLEKKNAELERRLGGSERKNVELESNQNLLLEKLLEAKTKATEQDKKIGILIDRVKELERTTPITPVETVPFKGRVLGVWPESLPLNTAGEKEAISKTGLEYDALEGPSASREGIVEQLGLREYSILEIGAKGGGIGIKLSDGIASPTWWAQLARQHHIDIFIVLANESSKPGVDNVADALFNAGVKYVISVDSSITDVDAVKFAKMFYRRLSRGVPLAKAVDYAKLVITDAGSDTIKLRERK